MNSIFSIAFRNGSKSESIPLTLSTVSYPHYCAPQHPLADSFCCALAYRSTDQALRVIGSEVDQQHSALIALFNSCGGKGWSQKDGWDDLRALSDSNALGDGLN